MWKNIVDPHRSQMTIWLMRIAGWTHKATNTHTLRVCNTYCWARVSSLSRLHDHTQTHHVRLGLFLTSGKPEAETSTYQHTTLTGETFPFRQRNSNPQSRKRSPQTNAFDGAATGNGYTET